MMKNLEPDWISVSDRNIDGVCPHCLSIDLHTTCSCQGITGCRNCSMDNSEVEIHCQHCQSVMFENELRTVRNTTARSNEILLYVDGFGVTIPAAHMPELVSLHIKPGDSVTSQTLNQVNQRAKVRLQEKQLQRRLVDAKQHAKGLFI